MPNMEDIQRLAQELTQILTEKNMMLSTAESCTAGLLGAQMTQKSGASGVYECGFITYSNKSKAALLGVKPSLIEARGAVSLEVAEAMASGALNNSNADISVSITGIAGPEGGSAQKPVGTVFFGIASKEQPVKGYHNVFEGTRDDVRTLAVQAALQYLISALEAQ